MPAIPHDPAEAIEAALVRIRRAQQRGRLAAERRPDAARFRCLDALDHGGMSASALADAIGVDRPRTTRLIARLEADGLANRTPDPGDGRRTVVTLTSAGREVVAAMHATRRRAVDDALEVLTPGERAELARLLPAFLDAWDSRRG